MNKTSPSFDSYGNIIYLGFDIGSVSLNTVIIDNDVRNVQRLCDYHYTELVDVGIVTQHSAILEEFGKFPCDKCIKESNGR